MRSADIRRPHYSLIESDAGCDQFFFSFFWTRRLPWQFDYRRWREFYTTPSVTATCTILHVWFLAISTAAICCRTGRGGAAGPVKSIDILCIYIPWGFLYTRAIRRRNKSERKKEISFSCAQWAVVRPIYVRAHRCCCCCCRLPMRTRGGLSVSVKVEKKNRRMEQSMQPSVPTRKTRKGVVRGRRPFSFTKSNASCSYSNEPMERARH